MDQPSLKTKPRNGDNQQEQDRLWMSQLISQAQLRKYYGKLIVTMEKGSFVEW